VAEAADPLHDGFAIEDAATLPDVL
jgi:hypothetical protein